MNFHIVEKTMHIAGLKVHNLVVLDIGVQRCGKSCRLRWINYLRPDIRRGRFTPDEEKLIIDLHAAVGNRYSSLTF